MPKDHRTPATDAEIRQFIAGEANARKAGAIEASDIAITGTADVWSASFTNDGPALADAACFQALTLAQSKYRRSNPH